MGGVEVWEVGWVSRMVGCWSGLRSRWGIGKG